MELPPKAFEWAVRLGEGGFLSDQLKQRIHHNRCFVWPVPVKRHLSYARLGCNLIYAHGTEAPLCYQAESGLKDGSMSCLASRSPYCPHIALALRIQNASLTIPSVSYSIETIPTVPFREEEVNKVIIITGTSSGLGRAFAQALLEAGFKVVGTVRKPEAALEFEQLKPGAAFARVLDVTESPERLASVVEEIEQNVGPVYALINNAGYGHEGTLEESSMDELRRQFEVNVFGAVAMMKAVLPPMRARREGRILNVTSMGGLMTMPGLSYYHGSKFALEGISSSLAKEVRPLGIYVTAIEPGMFRTDWAGRSMVRSERTISDYDAIFNPIREARKARSGQQPGDPAKAGKAIADLLLVSEPPLHLLLGPDAFEHVQKEFEAFRSEFAAWEAVTRSTSFGQNN